MSADLSALLTERRNPETMDFDELSTVAVLTRINQEDMQVPAAVTMAVPSIARLVDAAVEAIQQGGRLIYVGAGTSGRLGLLDAYECPPTFGVDPGMVVGVLAGGDQILVSGMEGIEDDEAQARVDLQCLGLAPLDLVVAIAASGRTPYTLAAMRYARRIGSKVGCIVNNPGSEMERLADYPVVVLCGPEVVTGSTRMKAGTAQKLVLNMLSTATMVRLGKVYENLMVDIQLSSGKTRSRALGMVCEITGVDGEEAFLALQRYGSVKAAALALLTGLEGDAVHRTLAANDGHLKPALQAAARPGGRDRVAGH